MFWLACRLNWLALVACEPPPPAHPSAYLPACLPCLAGLALGVDMDEQLPPNEYYDYYGPGEEWVLHSWRCICCHALCILSVEMLSQTGLGTVRRS